MTDELLRFVELLEKDAWIFEPDQVRRRIELLDRLDACFPDVGPDDASSAAALHCRASQLRERLEAASEHVFKSIRDQIRRGRGRETLLRYAPEHDDHGTAGELGYGFLDELISGVLRFEEPGGHALSDPEMVPYQPTPARHIFDLIETAGLNAADVLIDLGSGLGHVPLLVSICTPARCIGIELEAGCVERACQCAQTLNLGRVTFVHQDARKADLSTGTIFYLYTPFTGSILRSVLDRLRSEALRRPIRVCTYGPITPLIAQEPWLEAGEPPTTHRIAFFRSI